MNSIDIVHNGASPFESIRRARSDGSEYWSARDLMAPMGYPRWNEFQAAIERAKTSAANQNQNTFDLFRVSTENSGGRPRADFHLSRFAAYLVAMNGDPRKAEVAAAQAYFAVQTRKQELAQSAPALTSRRDLALAVLAAEEELSEARAELAAASPKVEYVDTFVADSDLRLLRAVAKDIGVQESALRAELIRRRWIYQEKATRWSESKQEKEVQVRYSPHADKAPYFQTPPAHDAPRFKGEVMHTLKVTPSGAAAIARAAKTWGLIGNREDSK